MPANLFGLINLNKPPGMSSRRALDHVAWAVKPIKTGHAGTLDPIACGVLIACIGPATRLVEYVHRMPKRYRATFHLGATSESDDIELPMTALEDPPIPSPGELTSALARFHGTLEQRPPAYSAAKIDGRRAYALARKGKPVQPEAKLVTIHRMQILQYSYPTLLLDITCGTGTYVRSIGRDLAQSLGTGAVMTALERTEIGPFKVQDGVSPDAIKRDTVEQYLLPSLAAVPELPRVELTDQEVGLIARGLYIDRASSSEDKEFAGIDPRGQLVALLRPRPDGQLGPLLNFAAS